MVKGNHDAGPFTDDPALFIDKLIKKFVRESPSNSFRDLEGGPFFDEPLVGFADGDDPIFQDYKTIIGHHHLTPKEALALDCQAKGIEANFSHVTVISFIMPISTATRLANRRETIVGSPEWNRTRWTGHDFIKELSRYIVSTLEGLGYKAVAPEVEEFHKVDLKEYTSNWSHRHMAYAAGLGTFGLTDGFLSPRGLAMRCGSVITDAVIPPTPRTYKDHYAACLLYQGKDCGRCIERCPAGAISENGHDKQKCSDYLNKGREIVKQLGRQGYIGHYAGCGLCQTGVPCEAGIPDDSWLTENPR